MRKYVLYGTAFGICLLSVWLIIAGIRKQHTTKPVYPVSRHIQYAFTLQNQTNRVVRNVVFRTYGPVKQTATQLGVHLESSHGFDLLTDGLENRILQFTFDEIPPYATRMIQIRADLQLSDVPNRLPEKNFDAFLQPQQYCESDHPEIRAVAEKLKGANPAETAKNIFNWVSGNLRYSGYVKHARGALYALRNKRGDCTEYMYLFAALCRANNIPSRCIGGYVCPKNMILKKTGYHNWAEFFIDDRWQISDPLYKTFMKNSIRYVAMRIIPATPDNQTSQFSRFSIRGPGIKAKMK